VFLEDAREQVARWLKIRPWSGTALVNGLGLPGPESLDGLLALELPPELAEPQEGLGHLTRLARRLGDERGEETNRVSPRLPDVTEIAIDARLELLLQLSTHGLRDLRPSDERATPPGRRSSGLSAFGARFARRLRLDGLLGRCANRRGGSGRRLSRGLGARG